MNELAQVVIRQGWRSPNRKEHWAATKKRRDHCQQEVAIHVATMDPYLAAKVRLSAPAKRYLKITILTARKIDPDNALAGCKQAIDALQAWRRVKAAGKFWRVPGPGLIWDDDPDHLEILSVEWVKQPQRRKGEHNKDLVITVLEE